MYNIEGIIFIGNVWEGILFSNFCRKKALFEKMLSVKICFIIQKELNQIIKLLKLENASKLVKFIVYFNLFFKMKHIFTDNIFSKNAFLLQKFVK